VRRLRLLPLPLVLALAGCGGGGHAGPASCAWRSVRSGTPRTEDLTGLSAPDARHVWVVGGIDRPVIRATTDGGRHWRAERVAAGHNGLADVSFPDDRHGWAVGVHNTLAATRDGGATWHTEPAPVHRDGNLYDVDFVDARHGWITGSHGLILATADGGRTWQREDPGTAADVLDPAFADRRHGLVLADDRALRTDDGGRTWTTAFTPRADRSGVVADTALLAGGRGWVSGSQDDGDATHGVVAATTDGGRTWKAHEDTGLDDVRFGAMAFGDARHGWVGGPSGDLLSTEDGAADWTERPSPTRGGAVLAMAFDGAAHGWAVGQAGTVLVCHPNQRRPG
jgi:photosystem II stability/assembly factor-like uncharacterized protein